MPMKGEPSGVPAKSQILLDMGSRRKLPGACFFFAPSRGVGILSACGSAQLRVSFCLGGSSSKYAELGVLWCFPSVAGEKLPVVWSGQTFSEVNESGLGIKHSIGHILAPLLPRNS